MSKKILYVIIIIVLIITGINVAKNMNEEQKTKPTITNTINSENKTNEENVVNEENNIIKPENIVTEENKQEEKQQELENIQNPEEKAKAIVKENWGEDDSVYYSYDGINSEGKYIICVRDKATTKALYWYYVDIETGAFDIE